MNCDSIEYINGNHLNASYQIYSKNDFTLKFVKDYLESCKNKYILTDTPNQHGQNYDGYYDHRHDQSILSILTHRYNCPRQDIDIFGYWTDWNRNLNLALELGSVIFAHRRGHNDKTNLIYEN